MRNNRLLLLLPILLFFLVCTVFINQKHQLVRHNRRPSLRRFLRRLTDKSAKKVFQKCAPGVVFIDTFGETENPFTSHMMEVPMGAGSGFLWDKSGRVITNFHVVQTATSTDVTITTSKDERKTYKAKIVGVDPGKDIAVLQIDAPPEDLHPLQVEDSNNAEVGDVAFAIGNPFGLDHSMTAGIVSGIEREFPSPSGRPIYDAIQTDADINPGNSGGPLLNGKGHVIGVNSMILSPDGGSSGVGFAVPINDVAKSVDDILRHGKVVRAALGVSLLDSTKDPIGKLLGIPKGVLVVEISEEGHANKSGLKASKINKDGSVKLGDVVVKVNKRKVKMESDLILELEKHKPGEKVTLVVERVGKKWNVGDEWKAEKVEIEIELMEVSMTGDEMKEWSTTGQEIGEEGA